MEARRRERVRLVDERPWLSINEYNYSALAGLLIGEALREAGFDIAVLGHGSLMNPADALRTLSHRDANLDARTPAPVVRPIPGSHGWAPTHSHGGRRQSAALSSESAAVDPA